MALSEHTIADFLISDPETHLSEYDPIHAILEQALKCPLTLERVIGSSSSRMRRIVLFVIFVPGS